jgi:FkbM family methyltransferase
MGEGRTRSYAPGGRQPVDAYDLTKVVPGQLILLDAAVSDSAGRVRFYSPKDPEHVSHSIVNFQNDYSTSTPFIEVDAITIQDVVARVDRSRLQLVKFDIEGSETAVIRQMLNEEIHPPQICVEFDELGTPTARAVSDFYDCHAALERAQYRVAHIDGVANFLYLHASLW